MIVIMIGGGERTILPCLARPARGVPLERRGLRALLYGLGMALTFDEFGMWLNLGGGYWQRASFDAVIVVLTAFGLIAFAPRWERWEEYCVLTACASNQSVRRSEST